jgi:hypothetical protein
MALGDVIQVGRNRLLKILEQANAVSGIPSGDGIPLGGLFDGVRPADLQSVTLFFESTGATATDITLRAWVKRPSDTKMPNPQWAPIGIGAATVNGVLNDGNVIPASSVNKITFTQVIDLLPHFEAIQIQVTALNGADIDLDGFLIVSA